MLVDGQGLRVSPLKYSRSFVFSVQGNDVGGLVIYTLDFRFGSWATNVN
jgi:hypothetical protein